MSQVETDGLAGPDLELADRRESLAVHRNRGAQDQAVWSSDRAQGAIIQAEYPRNRGPVIEADDELGPHPDPTAPTDDQTDEVQFPVRGGMNSIRRTAPSGVSMSVSRISVSPR